MMAWMRAAVRRHLIAPDPWPEYSRLDNLDDLNGTTMNDRTEPNPQLADIEARLREDEKRYSGAMIDQNVRDRAYLLALVKEIQARLDKVEAMASDVAERGERIEELFSRNGGGSLHADRAAGLGDGYREAARSIRAALGLAMSEPGGEATTTSITGRLENQAPPDDTPLPPEALTG